MITNGYDKPERAPGEFAPMAPAAVQEACRSYPPALALWLHAQSKPKGWKFGDRVALAEELGWSQYRVRKAITHLIHAGLYVVKRGANAAGQIWTRCRYVATVAVGAAATMVASSQVTPKAGPPPIPSVRKPARKELLRKKYLKRKKKEPAPHNPDTCPRNLDGLACFACGKVKATQQPTLWSPPSPSVAAAVVMGETGLECEHGAMPGKCGICRHQGKR